MISTLLVIINARAETQQQLAAHQASFFYMSLKTKSLPHPFVNYSRIVTAVVIRFPPLWVLKCQGLVTHHLGITCTFQLWVRTNNNWPRMPPVCSAVDVILRYLLFADIPD